MKRCKVCRKEFDPRLPMQTVCSPACALTLAQAKRAKAEKAKQVRQRKADKTKREKMKSKAEWVAEAQAAFNAYIRLRDLGKPCICCGQPLGESSVGGLYDCGHYRSVGSASHLRFHEDNANGQRKVCNRYGAGRAVDYRIGLIARIGIERVEALEHSNAVHKWTKDELIEITQVYRTKLKEMQE